MLTSIATTKKPHKMSGLLNCETSGCPDCSNWTGENDKLCGIDNMTYDNKCELFVSLCQQDIVSVDESVDIKLVLQL